MRMSFRGKEDVPTETLQTLVGENWYQDLKDVPSIALPEKALVGAGMSLNWRMEREEKPVYMEDGKIVSLYVVAFEREGGKMTTLPKKPDEELWYHQIVKNFALPRDDDLLAQPVAGAGICRSSDSWCDYVVVSDSLEGLVPAVIIRRPKPEPKETADIPPSNPDDPIDLESSPERLVRNKAGKRKQSGAEAEGQPAKKIQRKIITRIGNLDAFISESVPESLPVVNEELPPSPPRTSAADKLKNIEVPEGGTEKAAGVEGLGANKPVEVIANA
ncbi:hypothetical protein Hdeb2414_s0021g00575371 [Helianthus debilis subsp. tardiflorus]